MTCYSIKELNNTKTEEGIIMKKSLSLFIMSALLFTGLSQVTSAQTQDTDTSEASITFSAGDLSLEEVNNLQFGTHEIGEAPGNSYTATNAQSATITDYRGLADGNWSLNASVSNFTNENNSTTLLGFDLQFNGGTASTAARSLLTGPVVSNPNLQFVEEENGTVNFLSATDGNGRGIWTGNWAEVVLTIPEGSQTVGEHTATISWVLLDAPQ